MHAANQAVACLVNVAQDSQSSALAVSELPLVSH